MPAEVVRTIGEQEMDLENLKKIEQIAAPLWTRIPQHLEFEDHVNYMTAEVVEGFETTMDCTGNVILINGGQLVSGYVKVAVEKAMPLSPGELQPPCIPYRLRTTPIGGDEKVTINSQVSQGAEEKFGSFYRFLSRHVEAGR